MGKAMQYLFGLLLLLGGGGLFAQHCDKVIDASTPYIDWNNNAFKDIKAGDTVCLKAGNWDYIQLKDFHGTAKKPIVFINSDGEVIINTDHYFGIKIGGCSHIVFTGNGDKQSKYGIRILKVSKGAGLSVDDFSTDIEISHMEVSHTYIGGVYAKTDPNCNNLGATRDKFVMRNFSFHDNFVHDVANEGLYIGNSHYAGLTLTCNGHDTTVYPHVMKGVFIYNNLVENTGWDGIQVSSADSGCQVHDNEIDFDSQAGVPNQMSGILIGGGSVCKTYNNKIINGKGDGIDIFGMGNFNVFNNLIVGAGEFYEPNDANKMKHGIYLGKVVTTPDAVMGIYNNTIVSPKSFGMVLSNNDLKAVYVKNNLIVDPGKYDTDQENSFINVGNMDGQKVKKEANYTHPDVSAAKFVDSDAANYDLKPDSPAVNSGVDLTGEGITFDIQNRSRPFGNGFDIGAYECHDPSLGIRNARAADIDRFNIYPNPARNKVNLLLKTSLKQTVKIVVTDLTGRLVLRNEMRCNPLQNNILQLPIRHLHPGNYLVTVYSARGQSSQLLVIKK